MRLLAAVLLAHMSYPPECCHGDGVHGDCRPVPCAEITEDKDGALLWRHLKFLRMMQSTDGRCHVCAMNGDHDPICIFTPEATS